MIHKTLKLILAYAFGYAGGFTLFILFCLVVGVLTACTLI